MEKSLHLKSLDLFIFNFQFSIFNCFDYSLREDVDHAFLPGGLLAFASAVFRAGATGKVYLDYFDLFAGGETEGGRADEGYGFRVEEVGGVKETRVPTDY